MNEDDKNNPGPQPWIDPALEARVVAYVMGEASAFEAGELERLMGENPELAIFKRRIEAVHGLMAEAARPQRPKVQLSPERRQKLLETIGVKIQAPGEKVRVLSRPNPEWWSSRVLIRLAACLAMGAIVVGFFFSAARFEVVKEPTYFMAARFEQRDEQPISGVANGSAMPRSGAGHQMEDLRVSVAPAPAHLARAMEVTAPTVLMDQAKALPVTPDATPMGDRGQVQRFKKSEQGGSIKTPDTVNSLYTEYAKNTQSQSVSALLASDAPPSKPQAADKLDEVVLAVRPESDDQDEMKSLGDAESKPAPGWDSLYMYRGVNVLKYSQGENQVANNEVANKDVVNSIKIADASAATATQGSSNNYDGFVNYGSPILGPGSVAPEGGVTASSNLANQPVFSTRTDSNGNLVTSGYAYARSSGDGVQDANAAPFVSGFFGAKSSRFGGNSEEAQVLRQEAQSFFETGRFDLAGKRFEQALNIDPSDLSAREGLKQVASARAQYQDNSYNETRSRLLMQVNKGWELPVRRFEIGAGTIIQGPEAAGASQSINRKLGEIVIPRVEFRDATVREALAFLKQRAAELDGSEPDATHKGINIVMKVPPNAPDTEVRVTLSLNDIPLGAALEYVAKAANLKLKVEPYAVVLVPPGESTPARPASGPAAEVPTAKQPISTFSLHVSDVSFQLAKDALDKGTLPDPERIRPEEFYNAFDYNDPSPATGEQVAGRIEQCAHPFLQQRDLVRIALKVAAAGRAAGQPLRLTILLDTSGSMEREDRAASVRQALQTLATLLGPNDRVTLIGFARTPRLLAEQVPGDQAEKLVEIAARTPSDGGTNLEAALALASELALKQRVPAAQNRIVLLTDGAANLGDANPAQLARQIEKTRQQGISFDACGVGANGLNDEMLEALTRKGDGRYYFINKPEDADAGFARQLAGALRPAAENVKVQVVFNPSRVSQYRLIGFEKHLLKKEDFRNDKVQAAELSAEEAGVALYQVETLPEGEGELGEVFVRFRDPASGQMVEHSWTMPYNAKAPSFDQASPSMQLATVAALLAEKLQGRSAVDLGTLTPFLTNLRSQYPHQARVGELIQMFERLRQ